MGVGSGAGAPPGELRLLSIVAPVYNEEATIEQFYERGCAALEGLAIELGLVEDGSPAGAPPHRWRACPAAARERIAAHDPRVRVVYLSRNFGHQTALTAGLDHARGNAVVMLDAGHQRPPQL